MNLIPNSDFRVDPDDISKKQIFTEKPLPSSEIITAPHVDTENNNNQKETTNLHTQSTPLHLNPDSPINLNPSIHSDSPHPLDHNPDPRPLHSNQKSVSQNSQPPPSAQINTSSLRISQRQI